MTNRRTFLTTVATTAAVSAAGSVHTAEPKPEIRYSMSPPPPKTGPHTGTLDVFIQKLKPQGEVPLSFLKDEHRDLAAWKTVARAKLLELLHYSPEKIAPQPEVISRQDCGDYMREEIRFNTTPVFRVPATVLIPKGLTQPAPAVVLLHSHGGYYLWGRERELEGDDVHPTLIDMRQYYGNKAIGTELVRRGYVVISIDMFFWGERRMVLEDDPAEWKERPASISSESVIKFNQRSSASEQLMGRTLLSAGVTWPGSLPGTTFAPWTISSPDPRWTRSASVVSVTASAACAQLISRRWTTASRRQLFAVGCVRFHTSLPSIFAARSDTPSSSRAFTNC